MVAVDSRITITNSFVWNLATVFIISVADARQSDFGPRKFIIPQFCTQLSLPDTRGEGSWSGGFTWVVIRLSLWLLQTWNHLEKLSPACLVNSDNPLNVGQLDFTRQLSYRCQMTQLNEILRIKFDFWLGFLLVCCPICCRKVEAKHWKQVGGSLIPTCCSMFQKLVCNLRISDRWSNSSNCEITLASSIPLQKKISLPLWRDFQLTKIQVGQVTEKILTAKTDFFFHHFHDGNSNSYYFSCSIPYVLS